MPMRRSRSGGPRESIVDHSPSVVAASIWLLISVAVSGDSDSHKREC